MRSRPRRVRLAAVLVTGTLAGPLVPFQDSVAGSQPAVAPTADLSQTVRQLITELASKRRATRESARRRLLALGPGILEHLPAPASVKNTTTRAAIRRLRRTLEHTAASRSAQASRVTVSTPAPLEDLIASISKQTGNSLVLGPLSPDRRRQQIAIKLNRATYWEAVDALLARSGLDLAHRDGIGTLVTRSSQPTVGSVARSGPFRVRATARPPRPIPGSDRYLVPLRLSWQAEPRLRPLYLVCRPASFHATGRFDNDRSKSLAPRSPDATLEVPLAGDDPRVQLRLDFQSPGGRVPTEIELTGTTDVWLAARSLEYVFRGEAGGKPVLQRRGGVAVVLTSARFTPADDGRHDASFSITVQFESGGPSFESHRLWMLYNRAHLRSIRKPGTAHRVVYERFETPRLGDGIAQLVYHFKNLEGQPADWRFVFEAPTQILKVPVPLEFTRWKVPPARAKD